MDGFGSNLRLLLAACLLGGLLGGVYGCDTIISEFDSEVEPARDNPRDPESNNPATPRAVITSPDTATGVVADHSFEISWQPGSEGVTTNLEYQYRWALPWQDITERPWQPGSDEWTRDSTYQVGYLEESIEGQEYAFQVRAGVDTDQGYLEQETPTSYAFQVDAVAPRGLLFRPRRVKPENGIYRTEIWLDDIAGSDRLTGVKAVIQYDDEQMKVESVEPDGAASSLLGNSGGDIEHFKEVVSGEIEINIGVFGGDVTQIEGSGRIAVVTFSAAGGADLSSGTEITLTNASVLKDDEGNNIQASSRDAALLVGE